MDSWQRTKGCDGGWEKENGKQGLHNDEFSDRDFKHKQNMSPFQFSYAKPNENARSMRDWN
jgi:hypothetical protein